MKNLGIRAFYILPEPKDFRPWSMPTNLTSVLKVDGTGLRAMHRKTENEELFLLFREAGENGDYHIQLPSENGYLLDLTSGELQHLETKNGVLNLSLVIGETAVVLLTDAVLKAENKKHIKEKFNITSSFTIKKETELICGENGFDNIKHSDKAVSIKLGDWSQFVGNSYSGSGVYETSFTLPVEKSAKEGELNLCEVHFVASVFLNECPLGTKLAAPYKFKIPGGVLSENNTLKIVVTNTSANWYVHTDYFKRYKTEELSQYFDAEIEYAKDFLTGGLYGPVTIYTE